MSATVALTGLLPFIVLVAAALALPASLVLLSLYKRSVARGMRAPGTGGEAAQAPSLPPRTPEHPLRTQIIASTTRLDASHLQVSAWRLAARGPWHTTAVYAVAGAAYAAVMTGGWLVATRDQAIVWIKFLILFWTYAWPAALTVMIVAAYDRMRRLQLLALYLGALTALFIVATVRNPDLSIVQLPVYWAIQNGPATALLLTFLLRPIRAVGPLVLAFFIAVSIGSQAVLSLAAANESILRAISAFGFRLGLDATAVFAGMIVAGMLAFAALGWPLLRWLGLGYQRKRFSDQSLTVDSLWLLFAVVQSIGLAFEGPFWIFTGMAAFIAYKTISALGLRVAGTGRWPRQPKTLLLLRVFALGKRSERMFDRLRRHWQHAGSISMIAGPDLVTTTVEPHEFLDFLSRRLGRQFVKDQADLERRVSAIDRQPDPDGRYRIHEFFCHDDTWQMTMQRLAGSSDAVLMDLRDFSPSNQGCVFELGKLVDGVELDRIVFLIDDTTDRTFLEATLERLWQEMSTESPNQTTSSPTAKLFRVDKQSAAELTALLRLLLGAEPLSRAA